MGQANTPGTFSEQPEVFAFAYSASTNEWYNKKGEVVKIKPIPLNKLTKKNFPNKYSIVPAPNKFKPFEWMTTKDGVALKIITWSGYRFYTQRQLYYKEKLKDW